MFFNSIEYLLFFPIVFLLYWFVFRSIKGKNIFIVFASYVFYGWWSCKFLILIFITTMLSWVCGLMIGRSDIRKRRMMWLSLNIIVNAGILIIYKYSNFFADNFAVMLGKIGFEVDMVTLNLVLPVGISFYTFQAISYTLDVYRRTIRPEYDIAAFFAFISFFPQLVAGPIERAGNLLPQFNRNRKFVYETGVDGLKLILWGLFKKVFLADNCARIADLIFGNYAAEGSLNLWWGAVAFSFQIYGDFSGYSDMAKGSAKLLGIDLTQNFNKPYAATSISDFWRKWHISLQSWLRDYVYIPLGGSRKSKAKTITNTVTVFMFSGLWHGAPWPYIAWGGYHAALLIPGILMKGKNTDTIHISAKVRPFSTSVAMAFTFLLVCVGWVIFRSQTIDDACLYIKGMFDGFSYTGNFKGRVSLLAIMILIVGECISKKNHHPFDFRFSGVLNCRAVRWFVYITFSLIIILFSGDAAEFIYFQF